MRPNRTEAKAGGKTAAASLSPSPCTFAHTPRHIHLTVHWTKSLSNELFFLMAFLSFPWKWVPLIFADLLQSVAKYFYKFWLLINHNIPNLSRHLSLAKCILGTNIPNPLSLSLSTYVGCFSGVNCATLSSWANITNDLSFALRAEMSYGSHCLGIGNDWGTHQLPPRE